MNDVASTAPAEAPAPARAAVRSPYLKIASLTKKFGDFTALRDVSLEVYEGEFICFLGPSGCGKTTLLRTIAGLETQDAGSIEQSGRVISALPPAQRDFGIVFQSYALFPNLTVAQNVGYGIDRRRLGKAAFTARVDELLRLVGMPEQGGKYPAQLSGGQQQRVALARALATSPGLLLLDEPLSALDAQVRVRLRQEIKQLQHRLGVTTILVTHDQEEALTMADRIVVLNEGVIRQVGTPIEIYRNPIDPFVAAFVGSMNFLPAVAGGNGIVRLAGLEIAAGSGADDLAEGALVTVCVRPEDILVRDVRSTSRNALDVTVTDMEFLGFFFRARLALRGTSGVAFHANFSINLVRDFDVQVGRSMTIAFHEERLHVFEGV
jgi:iron(III) transport system ATP-binding protein